ncbi:acyl-CoA desaturase [Microseira wollei]|uniref:Delta-9 desaturase n=1 Tax=Microseira wollei NIES-4236 TaxID=2530354 RepID=A0AAV3X5E8_9CYAN|nr:acyl-CoA desaturase [Microseira wollei]GET35290.1 delta-9 desaturase [Microseira wollei NIES-4236]
MYKSWTINFGALPFVGVHLACLAAFWTGVDPLAIWMCVALFLIRKFGITGGYHRYFSHRSYETSRWFQFILGLLGASAAQRGPLWWASHHRHHHKYSDTDEDIHSAKKQGFYWSHVGWIVSFDYDDYEPKLVKDLTKYPELLWLERYNVIPTIILAVGCYLVHGWMGLVWGYFISTTILYHTTFAINSLCHVFGTQRYDTGESSKNSLWLALITLGEGWHNNHHRYQLSARQGFFWWEIDIAYYVLLLLSAFGIVWDLKQPPKWLLQPEAMIAGRG